MGSTGRASRNMVGYTTPTPIPTPTPQPQQPAPDYSNQVPTPQNTPVVPGALDALTKMSDSEMASLINSAIGVRLPNMLSDAPDATQQFVFMAGLNEKPLLLDSKQFAQYMKDNNIPQSQVMSRTVSGASYQNKSNAQIKLDENQINDMIKNSRLSYIGGKQGGQAYGAGSYFAMNGGGSTGYGSYGKSKATMEAVLNPKTTRLISHSSISSKWNSTFAPTHPQTVAAFKNLTRKYGQRGSESVMALLMGYNVIHDGMHDYHAVIDRRV